MREAQWARRVFEIFAACLISGSLLIGPATAQGAVIFVTPTGNDANSGLSWSAAKKSVTAGLGAAASGDQIWVAAGTYMERITLSLGVALYGGFTGTEDSASFDLASRDLSANMTTLDGGNAGTVVSAPSGATLDCRLDGFWITHGASTNGGGLSLTHGSATVANCTVAGNSGANGGGITLVSSSSVITNCTISGNIASGGGGGIYASGASPTIANNYITGNSDHYGGAGMSFNQSSGTIAYNVITNNSSLGNGGGASLSSSSPLITNNVFDGNSSAYNGGAIWLSSSTAMIVENQITRNRASQYGGGGIDIGNQSRPFIASNTIMANTAPDGGGVYCYNSTPLLVNNMIAGNRSTAWGAGIYLDACSPMIINTVIVGNSKPQYGGSGIYMNNSSPLVLNSTIAKNSDVTIGGSVYFWNNSSPSIINSIIAFNSSGIYREDNTGAPLISYTCTFGNYFFDYSGFPNPTGVNGNTLENPLFRSVPNAGGDGQWGTADDDYGDLQLSLASPAIDAGDPNFVPPTGAELDINGLTRIQDGNGDGTVRVDMGAYEFALCVGDTNYDRKVDLADLALVLSNYGDSIAPGVGGDVDWNGVVDLSDLALVLSAFATVCP